MFVVIRPTQKIKRSSNQHDFTGIVNNYSKVNVIPTYWNMYAWLGHNLIVSLKAHMNLKTLFLNHRAHNQYKLWTSTNHKRAMKSLELRRHFHLCHKYNHLQNVSPCIRIGKHGFWLDYRHIFCWAVLLAKHQLKKWSTWEHFYRRCQAGYRDWNKMSEGQQHSILAGPSPVNPLIWKPQEPSSTASSPGPTLCYQSQTWTMNKSTEGKITTCEMKCLRKAANQTRRDKIRKEVIRDLVGTKPMLDDIYNQCIKWFGHLVRMDPNQPAAKAYNSHLDQA